ncbi:MAG TPA: DUF4129 domain-containing protein [Armatimonadota bacterium]|nr:DUF4129 domain-containing protein [Armatimonadota bacterium]HQK94430.1 DUF4129 domain-containing protein [Armatimonadota bacterium]
MTRLLGLLAALLLLDAATGQEAPSAPGPEAWPSERAAPQAIKEAARQVLQSREFATDLRSAALRQVYERIVQAIRERLARLAGFLSASSRIAAVAAIVMAALCVVVAAYVIWLAVRGLPRARTAGGGSAASADEGEAEVIEQAFPSSAELRRRASALHTAGDLTGAVRWYFQAYLSLLHELGLVFLDPRRTNAEYVGSLGDDTEHGPRLREAVERFERVWYGGQPGKARDVEALEVLSRPAVGRAQA